mmetsp:Transcript_101574/g.287821  ORF Transcript_101574/g.287821 Transcript_101574/m.287821 type:complete len:244 (+) Transcript_101574:1193-1924(+)
MLLWVSRHRHSLTGLPNFSVHQCSKCGSPPGTARATALLFLDQRPGEMLCREPLGDVLEAPSTGEGAPSCSPPSSLGQRSDARGPMAVPRLDDTGVTWRLLALLLGLLQALPASAERREPSPKTTVAPPSATPPSPSTVAPSPTAAGVQPCAGSSSLPMTTQRGCTCRGDSRSMRLDRRFCWLALADDVVPSGGDSLRASRKGYRSKRHWSLSRWSRVGARQKWSKFRDRCPIAAVTCGRSSK